MFLSVKEMENVARTPSVSRDDAESSTNPNTQLNIMLKQLATPALIEQRKRTWRKLCEANVSSNSGQTDLDDSPTPAKTSRDDTRTNNSSYPESSPRPRSPLLESISERRSLMDEQNQAYQKSLKPDIEKDKVKAESERIEKEKVKTAEAINEELRQRRLEALETLPEEPSDDEKGVITLELRLPSGLSARRNFRPTDTIFTLKKFIMSHDTTPLFFEVIRYPKEKIPVGVGNGETSITLQDYGFKGKEVLHVQALKSN